MYFSISSQFVRCSSWTLSQPSTSIKHHVQNCKRIVSKFCNCKPTVSKFANHKAIWNLNERQAVCSVSVSWLTSSVKNWRALWMVPCWLEFSAQRYRSINSNHVDISHRQNVASAMVNAANGYIEIIFRYDMKRQGNLHLSPAHMSGNVSAGRLFGCCWLLLCDSGGRWRRTWSDDCRES